MSNNYKQLKNISKPLCSWEWNIPLLIKGSGAHTYFWDFPVTNCLIINSLWFEYYYYSDEKALYKMLPAKLCVRINRGGK